VINETEPQTQDEIEVVHEEPQTSKDAEIEALRKEVEVLTKTLQNQQWHDREEEPDFQNPFAKQNHRLQEWENHCVRTTNLGSRSVKEASYL
jgi:hypothetical protein